MKDEVRTRSKLTVTRHPKTLEGILPMPQIEQGLDRSRGRPDMRSAVDGFRQKAHDQEAANQQQKRSAENCENGDGKGLEIAAFLAPVKKHFDLDPKGEAELAAFTRKLLSGGRPKRGSYSSMARNVDRD